MFTKPFPAFILLTVTTSVLAGPNTITYQGSVQDAGGRPVADGAYRMHFVIHDQETADSVKWQETDDAVQVRAGLFSTTLGDQAPFGNLFNYYYHLWLEVSVDLDDSGSFEPGETFAPRQKLACAAWAMDSDKLDGRHSSDFALVTHNHDGLYWSLTGNAGTNSGTNFLGTTDDEPLVLATNGVAGFRLQSAGGTPNVVGGYSGNSLYKGVAGAAIGGGGTADDGFGHPAPNQVTDDYGAVGGGADNQAGNGDKPTTNALYATVAGGFRNHALGAGAAIGGGLQNEATTSAATVAGGTRNTAGGAGAFVGGGAMNAAGGAASVVPGGLFNTAMGDYSFAAGFYAQATHEGAFVWADHQAAPFASTSDNEFRVRASGGVDFQSEASKIMLIPHGSGPSFVAGHVNNHFDAGVFGATISGGGSPVAANRVADDFGTVGGGEDNQAGGGSGLMPTPGIYATVGGGKSNEANGRYATIAGGSDNLAGNDMLSPTQSYPTVGGGYANEARANHATIGGGMENEADGDASVIGGGDGNLARASYSTIPGGRDNQTDGAYSLAAGRRATTLHDGSFVWADSLDHTFYSAAVNGFRARTTGGAQFITGVDGAGNPSTGVYIGSGDGAWQTYSDRNGKENPKPVDPRGVLARVADLPIATWNYKTQDPSIRHMGPMAQDFRAAFGLGDSDKTISTIDPDGVALAAIQGLLQVVEEKEAEIGALKARADARRLEIEKLEARLAALEAHVLGDSKK